MLYLYGIIDTDQPYSFIETTSGRKVYNLPVNGLGMIVSQAESKDAEKRAGNILAHNAVMEHIIEHFTVLPVSFGTLIYGESGVKELFDRYAGEFGRQLHRLRGKLEMGVKVIWNMKQAQIELPNSGTLEVLMCQKLHTGSPGHKYLLSKYRKRAPEMHLRRIAKQNAEQIHSPLSAIAEEACCSILRTPSLMLSGAYLLLRCNVNAFREEYLRLRKNYPNYNFLLSGPWPPYNFVKINCSVGSD